jgi:hypothetical protein
MEPIRVDGAVDFYELPTADITGEGDPDVLISTRTGGSHCCIGAVLFNLGAQPVERLRLSGGIGSLGGSWLADDTPIRDWDGDGRYEIIGQESPTGLPCTVPTAQMILVYEDGGYHNGGVQYPDLFQAEIEQRRARVMEMMTQNGTADRCAVLELMLSYYYSGQMEAAWQALDDFHTESDKVEFRQMIEAALQNPDLFLNQ